MDVWLAPSDDGRDAASLASRGGRRGGRHAERPFVGVADRSAARRSFISIAEEFDHEFAPGCVAKCWGYNGSTPGPTIEAVEGDRVRILVTNHLQEPTTIHWHGLILPERHGRRRRAESAGHPTRRDVRLRVHAEAGRHAHVPPARRRMVQMAFGMMGFFIIHPKDGEAGPVDRDFAIMLHNWALHPGTYRPDPAVMLELQSVDVQQQGVSRRPRRSSCASTNALDSASATCRCANHPIHLHGHKFWVTGSDGDRWPKSAWRSEVTEIVGVGQMRDFEFVADNPGDWAFHCHMSHHTMNAMGHDVPNPIGVDQSGVDAKIRSMLPGYMAMGETGMSRRTPRWECRAPRTRCR